VEECKREEVGSIRGLEWKDSGRSLDIFVAGSLFHGLGIAWVVLVRLDGSFFVEDIVILSLLVYYNGSVCSSVMTAASLDISSGLS
jgi:hypothetical protein